MSDYISREAMSETPKCPGCGADMELMHLCNAAFCYACTKCGWDSPVGIDSESAFRMAMRRAEPKNRVLTLEEAQKKCQEDRITWYESLRHESPIVSLAYVTPIDPTDELVNIYTFFASTEETVELYGKDWRCWLRKPTETERRETPWAGDSHE